MRKVFQKHGGGRRVRPTLLKKFLDGAIRCRVFDAGRGFTLVELLVVVAVIGILAALSSAAVSAARGASNSVKCVANLRQIGMAFTEYSNEHLGYEPPHYGRPFFDPSSPTELVGWPGHLATYLGATNYAGPVSSIFFCPSDPDATPRPANLSYAYNTGAPVHPVSYGYNYVNFTTTKGFGGEENAANVRRLDHPSSVILVADSTPISEGGTDPSIIYSPFLKANLAPSRNRHGNSGYNAVFVDGHVQWMNFNETANNTQYWSPR